MWWTGWCKEAAPLTHFANFNNLIICFFFFSPSLSLVIQKTFNFINTYSIMCKNIVQEQDAKWDEEPWQKKKNKKTPLKLYIFFKHFFSSLDWQQKRIKEAVMMMMMWQHYYLLSLDNIQVYIQWWHQAKHPTCPLVFSGYIGSPKGIFKLCDFGSWGVKHGEIFGCQSKMVFR